MGATGLVTGSHLHWEMRVGGIAVEPKGLAQQALAVSTEVICNRDRHTGTRPLIWGHRGASDSAPENTLAAFKAAVRVGADGIELDVMHCGSGEIVVIHDDSVDRTTNASGHVGTMPLDTLRMLDAGARFAPGFSGEIIPTLEEVLDTVGHRVRANIEIKSPTSGLTVW